MLSDAQKQALVELARRTVTLEVGRTSREGTPAAEQAELAAIATPLPDASGVFVTIRRRGELRGCLGTLQFRSGLAGEVVRCAADAATEDPRFPPVTAAELPEITIEVSVLGPLEAIDPRDAGAIQIGRHGLVAEQGHRRGLLLPQVATEWGFDRGQFLAQTCAKAGLPRDAWQRGARIYRFEAEVFGDRQDLTTPD